MKAVRAAASAVLAAAFLVGPPIAFVHLFGRPWPDRLPTLEEVQQWVDEPLNRISLLAVLELFLWAAWALLAASITVDAIRAGRRLLRTGATVVRRHPARHLLFPPVPVNSARPAAPVTVLAGAVAAAVPTAGTVAAAPAAAAIDTSVAPPAGTDIPPPTGITAVAVEPSTPNVPVPEQDHDRTRHGQAPAGWWLPDGSWIALPTALALLAVWRTLATVSDGRATPRTVAALLRRVDRHTQRSGTPPRATPATQRNVHVQPPATAPDGRQRPGWDVGTVAAVALPAGGVGLTGDGAASAARGLLITTLFARPGAVHILVTASDWQLLSGGAPPPPEVSVLPDLQSALTAVEYTVLAADPAAATPAGPDGAAMSADGHRPAPGQNNRVTTGRAPVLLIATVPPPADTARLAIALRLGRDGGTGAVLIGPWPHGTTWHVDHAGRISRAADHPEDRRQPHADPLPDWTAPKPRPTVPSAGTHDPNTDRDVVADTDVSGGLQRLTVLTATAAADILRTRQPAAPATTPGKQSGRSAESRQPLDIRTTTHRTIRRAGARRHPVRQPLALTVLGPAHLAAEATGTPVKLPRQVALDILVLLAVHPDGLDRDSILEAIWPDVRHRAAVRRLHPTLSSLRTTAAEVTATPVVVLTDGRYRLNPAAVDVDLWRLNHHVGIARRSEPTQARAHWRTIIDLTRTRPRGQADDSAIRTLHPDSPTASAASGGTGPDRCPGEWTDLATGMSWPWLLEHRQSLHAAITEAQSRLHT